MERKVKGGDGITDIKKLKDAIRRSGLKIQHLAEMLGLSRAGMSLKINGKLSFLSEEMFKVGDALNLSDAEIREIFFAQDVDETERRKGVQDDKTRTCEEGA